MPTKKAGETRVRSPKLRTVTVTDRYGNAAEVEKGDRFKIRPGTDFEDGELVAIQIGDSINVIHLYRCKSRKVYAYYGKYYPRMTNRHMYTEHLAILCPVVATGQRRRMRKEPQSETFTADFEWSFFGIHRGDDITVATTGQAKPGQLILLKTRDGQDSVFTRVCTINEQTVRTICECVPGKHEDSPLSDIIGPAVKIECGENCVKRKVKALREGLAGIDEDDSTNSTARLKVEAEIYALEHPRDDETPAVSEDWPDVIGEGGDQ